MAYLTKQDLQYEDTNYKDYWASQYGYDYSANSVVQENIHKVVLGEVELGIESFSGEKSLAPTPGSYSVNGFNFIVSAEDRDAYCARYPQVCRTGSQRDAAILKIKNGGTHSPEEIPVEPEATPDETPSEPPATPQPEETEPTESLTTTPELPEPPTVTTHKVKTSGSRLAFRKEPSSVSVSEIATQDEDKKGELIEMLENSSGFTVLDPGVGYQCEWHYIKHGSSIGYVYNKFTEEVPDCEEVYLEYDCESPYDSPFNISPDWTTKELNKAYEDKSVGKWCVPYETSHASTGGAELHNRMLEVRIPATKVILSELGKNNTDEYASTICEAVAAIRAEDYYVSDRPGENMRVLVTLPIKYVNHLEAQNPIIQSEEGQVFTGEVYSEKSDVRKGTTRQTILYLDPSASYKDRVKRVSEGMRTYATQVDNFDGEVKNLDFRKEADRFEKFIESFNTLLSANSAPKEGAHSIELGMNQDFIPTYASQNASGFYKAMPAGWDAFKDSEPADSQRSIRYLFYLWDMEQAVDENMDWIEFVGRFTDYELVEIFPSASAADSVSDVSGMGNEENPSSSGQTAADKVDKKVSPPETAGDSCFENVSVKGLANGIIRKGKSLKSAKDKLKEDLIFGSADIRKSIRKEAKATVDFVGEPLLSDINNQMSKINELDDVFEVVLNKISLMDLVGAIMACFNVDFKLDIDLNLPLPLRLDCLTLPTIPTIKLPDDLPTMDIMADLPKEIFNAIVDALTQAFVAMIKDLVVSLLDLCKEESEDTVANINDAIEEATEAAAMNQDEAIALANQKKKDVLAAAGLLGGPFSAPLSEEDKADRLSDLSLLLGDISLLVSPSELCRLLYGRSSTRTLTIVRSLVNRKYPNFKNKLKTKTSIKDFMILIGRMVDSSFCEQLAKAPQTKYGVGTLCDTTIDDLGTPEAERIRSKGDDITEDQILEQLDRGRKRKEKRANDLADILTKLADLQSGRANPFQDAMPPLFCGTNPDGSPKPGLIELKHESIDFMMDKVMDVVFEPIFMAFNRDVSSYKDVMITNTNVTTEVAAAKPAPEDGYMWHPEVLRQNAQGVQFDFYDGGDAEFNNLTDKIQVQDGVRKVNTTTQKLLNNLEGTGAFVTKLDTEGVYYEMVLPPDPDTRMAIEQLKEQLAALGDIGGMGDVQVNDIDWESLMQTIPDWRIRYKIPYQTSEDKGRLVDDEYVIEIFPGEDPEATDLSLRREISAPVNDSARAYIQELYPEASGSVFEEPTSVPFDAAYALQNFMTVCDEESGTTTVEQKIEDPCNPTSTVPMFTLAACPDKPTNLQDILNSLDAASGDPKAVCEILIPLLGTEFVEDERIRTRFEDNWDCISGYFHAGAVKHMPPQAEVFGRQAEKMWSEALSGVNTSDDELLGRIRKYYASYVHPQVTNDVVSMIAKRIANSTLFQSHDITVPGMDTPTSTPYLEKVVFLREPTKIEKACNIDPHPLTVEEYKKQAKDEFQGGGGFCSLIEGVADAKKQDPMRAAMLKSVAQMTIRAYVIDYFLRGVFAFTTFSIEETLDDYVLEFMIKKMIEEMRSYEGEYSEMFLEYINSISPKQPDASSQLDKEAPISDDGTVVDEEFDTDSDPEEVVISNLKKLFVDEFAVVAVELKDLIQRSDKTLEDEISFDNSINVHDLLIGDKDGGWIPVIDLPNSEKENRFSDIENAQDVSQVSSVSSFDNGLDFDLSNGNMFLETFFKVVKKDWNRSDMVEKILPSISGLRAIVEQYVKDEYFGDDIGDNNEAQNMINTWVEMLQSSYDHIATTGLVDILDNSWNQTFGHLGVDGEVYVGVREIDRLVDEFVGLVASSTTEYSVKITPHVDGSASIVAGAGVGVFQGVDDAIFGDVGEQVWKFDNFFTIETGMRLCYVSPIANNPLESKVLEDLYGAQEFEGLGSAGLYGTLNKKYRSFMIEEQLDLQDQTMGDGRISLNIKERKVYATPLIEVRDSSINDQLAGMSLLDLSVLGLPGTVGGSTWSNTHYNSEQVGKMKQKIKDSPEYAALFKFSVPTERFLGMLTVYTMMSVSASPRVEAIFEGTKDELMRTFMALSNPDWKAPEGPSNGDIAKFHEHFGGLTTPCFSFSWGMGGMPGFKGLGMDLVLKLAVKTPLLIFKAVVEMIDPNIKIAKWIIDLAKFIGICLPMPVVSLGLLPPTVFGFPPFGFGIGPLLTPLGFGYLALGFEIPIGNPFADDGNEDENDVSEEQCNEERDKKQQKIKALKEKILAATQK